MQRAAVTRGAGAVEDRLALLLELVQLRVRVREGRAGKDRVREAPDSSRRKQCLLESREVIERPRRRFDRHLRVREERAARLFLQGAEARIVLVASLPVRAVGVLAEDRDARHRRPDRQDSVRSGDRDVEHGHDRAPEIDRCLGRGLTGRWIDDLNVQRQRHRHAYEPVLHQVREVARVVPVHAEVVGVDRPKERIVRVLVTRAPGQQRIEPGPGHRRRELERVRRHVAVGACASVSTELLEIAVIERRTTPRDVVAWLAVAIELQRRSPAR